MCSEVSKAQPSLLNEVQQIQIESAGSVSFYGQEALGGRSKSAATKAPMLAARFCELRRPEPAVCLRAS